MNSIEIIKPNKFVHPNLYSSLSNEKIDFICELIKKYKPASILELGVKHGCATVKYLNFINNCNLNTRLTSIDIDKNSGSSVLNYNIDKSRFKLITGKSLKELESSKSITFDFDFVILDTEHFIPGEISDYMIIQKYMKTGSVVVLDDPLIELSDYVYPENKNKISCNSILAHSITGKKYILENNLDIIAIELDENRLTWLDFKLMLSHRH